MDEELAKQSLKILINELTSLGCMLWSSYSPNPLTQAETYHNCGVLVCIEIITKQIEFRKNQNYEDWCKDMNLLLTRSTKTIQPDIAIESLKNIKAQWINLILQLQKEIDDIENNN